MRQLSMSALFLYNLYNVMLNRLTFFLTFLTFNIMRKKIRKNPKPQGSKYFVIHRNGVRF